LKSILVNYPTIWVKNVFSEEGGSAGVWVKSSKNSNGYVEFEWEDLCLELKSKYALKLN